MRALILLVVTLPLLAAPEPKKESPLDRGATKESEAAVARGLRWLALHQCADGSWSMRDFKNHARTEPLPKGKVAPDDSTSETSGTNDVAATAMALLPFLAAGHSPKGKPDSPYRRTVEAGLRSLISQRTQVGARAGMYGPDMYTHALAVIALCEGLRLSKDAALRSPARDALAFLEKAQHAEGGWRYTPGMAGDLSITGFCVRALASAQRAGLAPKKVTIDRAAGFVKASEAKPGLFTYIPRSPSDTPSMTAVGLHCQQLFGVTPREDARKASLQKLAWYRENGPAPLPLYFTFYATRAVYEEGGKEWEAWNKPVRDKLVALQDTTNKGNGGSWRGDVQVGGRIGATSFALLSLLVYHEERGQLVPPRVEP